MLPAGEYAHMTYPGRLPMMKLDVDRYRVPGFGQIMCMTTSMMKLMNLCTVSFTPNEGSEVPFLLVDMMSMGKKRLTYVEFYDCTACGTKAVKLEELEKCWAAVSDYDETPAWYVEERMKGSLIKSGSPDEEPILLDMAEDAVRRYVELWRIAPKSEDNLTSLRAFRDRMFRDGNPSSATLERILGKEGAVHFFCSVVMPLEND